MNKDNLGSVAAGICSTMVREDEDWGCLSRTHARDDTGIGRRGYDDRMATFSHSAFNLKLAICYNLIV